MEWVETTGRTIDEAKRAALEQLGVAETDADFEVVAEAKLGLFGRLKEEARVRARVRPRYPRAKVERRDRRRSRLTSGADTPEQRAEGQARSGRQAAGKPPRGARPAASAPPSVSTSTNRESQTVAKPLVNRATTPASADGDGAEDQVGARPAARRRRRHSRAEARETSSDESRAPEGANFSSVKEPTEEYTAAARAFLEGLLAEMGATATVTQQELGEGLTELLIQGDELGTLIGPKGTTLLALQELTRTVLQHKAAPPDCRIVVDVNGYRRKRQVALARFAKQVAEEAVASGSRRALEPMSSSDRKVVHDAVNELSGVTTVSEGEEPYRRVVILPEPGRQADQVGEGPVVVATVPEAPGEEGRAEDGQGPAADLDQSATAD